MLIDFKPSYPLFISTYRQKLVSQILFPVPARHLGKLQSQTLAELGMSQ